MTDSYDVMRTYKRTESIVFRKTNERFGGLSNMAGGYPVSINGVEIRTVEALYQACRFPSLPDVQRAIIEQKSPMTAKMKGKPHRNQTREDWDKVRVNIMRWCLRVKLIQNWEKFGQLLNDTGEMPIVEESKRDKFWGANPMGDDLLVGLNILGRLLMELRVDYKNMSTEYLLEPPMISNFVLFREPIGAVSKRMYTIENNISGHEGIQTKQEQMSIYDVLKD
jgi:ribA/ribD-fused uncharacterized protein